MVRRASPAARPAARAAVLAVAALLACLAAEPPAAAQEEGAPPAAQTPGPEAPPAGAGPERRVLGMIRGAVLDAKRRPMAGLMVQLAARGERGLLRVTGTDERGEYVFSDLPAGVYDVELAVDGRRHRKESIAVRPPFRNIVDFQVGAGNAGGTPAAPALPVPPAAAPAPAPPDGAPAAVAPVAVRGRFVDTRKHPIPEVSVTLVALAGGAVYQTFSRDDGAFLIEAVPPGPYRVLVSSPGHVALDLKSVDVAPGRGLDLSLSLVDYPLNFKDRRGETPPREEPREAP